MDGVVYTYYYAGDKLMRMTVGTDKVMDFTYDQNGRPYSVTQNGVVSYYVLNQQGDVVRIVNASGATRGEYRYDAWGNLLYITDSDFMRLNPLRYRGYVYDAESKLYYCQSRYYDPATGRFINSDTFAATGQGLLGNNMFAYCGNNPVKRADSDGAAWETVWDAVSFGASLAEVIANPDDVWAWIGLVGDTADLLIPFVGGIGETARAINAAAEVVDTVDDVYDAGKAADHIDDAADAYKAMSEGLCFVAGTSVLTAVGCVAIEDIQTGDFVWAWDEETGDTALKEVVETYVNTTNELVHVFVNGEEIVSTPSHPFYSPVRGWTEAVHLRAGDILQLVNGEYVVVEKIQHEILEAPVTVYNFQVEDFHTYYVASGVLVHNMCSADLPATTHGKIRIGERGLTQREYELLKASANTKTQADGATVYIRAITSNNHNVLVENDVGEIITFMKNVTKHGLRNLADNYGWI